MSDYGKTALAITITTDIEDPDAAIAWVREQLSARLGTQGDEGEDGWFNTKMGTPRWQVVSVRVIRDNGSTRQG